jgi:hypothetical protein
MAKKTMKMFLKFLASREMETKIPLKLIMHTVDRNLRYCSHSGK